MTASQPPVSTRAARYIRQPAGYRAIIPAALAPDPPRRLGAELQLLLSQDDRALGRLGGSIVTLPNPDHLVFTCARTQSLKAHLPQMLISIINACQKHP